MFPLGLVSRWCSWVGHFMRKKSLVSLCHPLALCWAPLTKRVKGTEAVLWLLAWILKCISFGQAIILTCMYLSNQVCSCMSRNHISKFLGKVFFCSKCITKQKLGVALADTVHIPLWVAWQELYIHQIPVPLSCLLGKLFGNVDLQVIYVRILILLQRWDAVVSKVYSSCGFVDTGLWPGK